MSRLNTAEEASISRVTVSSKLLWHKVVCQVEVQRQIQLVFSFYLFIFSQGWKWDVASYQSRLTGAQEPAKNGCYLQNQTLMVMLYICAILSPCESFHHHVLILVCFAVASL